MTLSLETVVKNIEGAKSINKTKEKLQTSIKTNMINKTIVLKEMFGKINPKFLFFITGLLLPNYNSYFLVNIEIIYFL